MSEPLEHEVLVTVGSADLLPWVMTFAMPNGTTCEVEGSPSSGFPVPAGAVRIVRLLSPPIVAPDHSISIGVGPGRRKP